MILLFHTLLNNPSQETISAGLGPVEQYGVILIILFIALFYLLRKKTNKFSKDFKNKLSN